MSHSIHIISDTHGYHNKLNLIGGDILIHCGDFANSGSMLECFDFVDWYKDQDYSSLILINGNHDRYTERNVDSFKEHCERSGIMLLNDESIVIDGIKIHGSPVQPEFCNWAWNRFRGSDIQRHWDLIPKDTELLITHGPPYGVLDKCTHGGIVGCQNLLNTIQSTPSIKAHFFGHIHEQRGHIEQDGVLYVNAASLTEHYKPYPIGITKVIRDDLGKYSVVT